MKLTRPQRKSLLLPSWAVLWAALAVLLWMPATTHWVFPPAGGAIGRVSFGLMTYAVVERQSSRAAPVLLAAMRGPSFADVIWGDGSGRVRWYWNHSNLFLTVFATAGLSGLCRAGYRWSMNRRRLIGRCDECGYLLTSVRSSVCPECGTPRPGEGALPGDGADP